MLSPAPDEQHAGGADDRPTVGSMFAGIGGIDIGLERVGFRTAWFCERDKFCQQVLAKHWPNVPCYDDVRELGEGTPRVDVLAGGFPCQPISNAGKRLAQADERWLWPEVARLIRILRPRAVLLENVAALLGRGFDDILGDLAASGYDAEWDCIPAAAVGAPHRRDRVFIIATRSGGMANPAFMFSNGGDHYPGINKQSKEVPEFGNSRRAKNVANANHERCNRGAGGETGWREQPTNRSSNATCEAGIWPAEPAMGRMANGIPRRVDRLRGLGNAVVPQVAEVVGRRVMEILRGN